jgi:hypothetical protein
MSRSVFFKWFTVALLSRLVLLAAVFLSAKKHFPERLEGFAFVQNDCQYFLDPVDVYLERGQMELREREGIPFAGRMPGYSAPYFLLRLVFERATALSILMLLQILLSAAAVVITAWLASQWFSGRYVFHGVFFLMLFSFHLLVFDFFTLAESFSVSAFCFFLYFFHRFYHSRKNSHLVWAGFFMAWLIFLRPFAATLFILIPACLMVAFFRKSISFTQAVVSGFIFIMPFLLFESAWIYRNYRALGKFVPLETSITESYGERGAYRTSAVAIRQLIFAWGGETGEFYAGSEADWFHNAEPADAAAYIFKPHVFYASFNKDSLIELKRIFNRSIDFSLSDHELDSLNRLAASMANRWAKEYQSKNKIRYYLLNPAKRFKSLMTSNATMLIPFPAFSEMNLMEKGIKVISMFHYYLITAFGMIGTWWYFFKFRFCNPVAALVALAPWVLIVTIVMASDIMQFRYILTATPVWIVFSVYFAGFLINRLSKKPAL